MNDLFGFAQPRPIFKDIRDQRPTTAEKKAVLCKQLGELLRTAPPPDLQCGRKDRKRVAVSLRQRQEGGRKFPIKLQRLAGSHQSNE